MKVQKETGGAAAAVRLVLGVLVLGPLSLFCASGPPTSAVDRSQLRAALEAYVLAGDARDLGAMETIMHPLFRAVVQFKGSPQVNIMSRSDMLGLLKSGKIGGEPRAISFHGVETRGDVGSARATLQSSALRFHALYSFVRENGEWRMIQDSVLAEKL